MVKKPSAEQIVGRVELGDHEGLGEVKSSGPLKAGGDYVHGAQGDASAPLHLTIEGGVGTVTLRAE